MENQSSLEAARAKLEQMHIRLTPQRLAVLELLYQEEHSRPSVETLCRLLAPRYPRLNAATVRNTVHVFEKMGLVPEPSADRSAG